MEIYQIDIKGAFLNRKLTDNEVIYMYWLSGYKDPDHPEKVHHLKKTIYGLKQSGRQWYQHLCKILVDILGFMHSENDPCMFFFITTPNLTIIAVHINDCTLMATKIMLITWVKKHISEHVEITNLG